MNRNRLTLLVAGALVGGIALVGCKKNEPAPPPAMSEPAPTAILEQPAATVSVVGVSLGNDPAASSPATTFAPNDTIYAVVSTQTSSPEASVSGNLGAKWSHVDSDQVINEESKEVSFTGPGNSSFHISKPDGWPTGNYRLEVSLDGNVVNTTDFQVQ